MDLAAGWVQAVAFFSELDNNSIKFLKTYSGPMAQNSELIYYMLFLLSLFHCVHFPVSNTKQEPPLLTVTDGRLSVQLGEEAGE